MSTTKKISIGVCVGFLAVSAGAYAISPAFRMLVSDTVTTVKSFTIDRGELVDSIRQELFSSPLFGTEDNANAALSIEGVVAYTNAERGVDNKSILTLNTELSLAAKAKLDDMFRRQYFEHISPDGHGPGYLAEQAGYDYVLVGENLALGNFKDDRALVDAWMASPGHRANILNERFTEIGVAVGRGTFEGRTVWLAVQEFGKPLSDCPRTDPLLRAEVDRLKNQADTLGADLAARKRALDNMPRNTPEEAAAYNRAVSEYNAGVTQYDQLSKDLKVKIDEYNAQVKTFNACIKR